MDYKREKDMKQKEIPDEYGLSVIRKEKQLEKEKSIKKQQISLGMISMYCKMVDDEFSFVIKKIQTRHSMEREINLSKLRRGSGYAKLRLKTQSFEDKANKKIKELRSQISKKYDELRNLEQSVFNGSIESFLNKKNCDEIDSVIAKKKEILMDIRFSTSPDEIKEIFNKVKTITSTIK